jgi:hypothetical protein
MHSFVAAKRAASCAFRAAAVRAAAATVPAPAWRPGESATQTYARYGSRIGFLGFQIDLYLNIFCDLENVWLKLDIYFDMSFRFAFCNHSSHISENHSSHIRKFIRVWVPL